MALWTVRPSGGDYTSLDAACGDATGHDVVADAEILTIRVEGDWSGGADTAAVFMGTGTRNETYYVQVDADSANYAGTALDTNKYLLDVSGADAVRLNGSHVRVKGLQIRCSNDLGIYYAATDSGDTRKAEDCWIRAQLYGISVRGGDLHVTNCILISYDGGGTGRGINVLNSTTDFWFHNVTMDGWEYGVHCTQSYGEITNTGFVSCTTDIHSSWTGTASNNSTSTPTWDTAHALSSSDTTWKGQGTDLSSHSDSPVTTDILGTTRPATPSIGAHEPAAAAAGAGVFRHNVFRAQHLLVR